MPLLVGTRLGPYETVSMLGFGGTGEVYKPRDTCVGRTVALELIGPLTAVTRSGFMK